MRDHIDELALDIQLGKGATGMAYRQLIELAIADPLHKIRDFKGDEDKNCVLDNIKAAELEAFSAYARTAKTKSIDGTFKSMIYRGLSIHLDHKDAQPKTSPLSAQPTPQDPPPSESSGEA